MTTELWRAEELGVIETAPIWRKRVTIAGRSVSLSLILAVLLTVTALAAFFTTLLGDVDLATGGEQQVNFVSAEVLAGTMGECSIAAPNNDFAVKAVGGLPGQSCTFRLNVVGANADGDVFVDLVSNPSGNMAGLASITNQTSCGTVLTAGAATAAVVDFTIAIDPAAEPATALLGDLQVSFPLIAPAC